MPGGSRGIVIGIALSAAVAAGPVGAQQDDLFVDEAELLESLDDDDGDRTEFVVAPIPIVNPTVGTGLALGAMYLFHLDETSQPSFVAAGGAYTDSESSAFGIGQAAYFGDDAWKIKAGGGVFDLNLRYFGIGRFLGDRGRSIPINQEGWAAGIRGLRRLRGDWYGGLQYWFASVKTTFDTSDLEIELPPVLQADSRIAGLGVMIEFDSRDNRFNPTAGVLFNISWDTSNETLGSDFEFSSGRTSYNVYREIRPSNVIAGRATLCATPGDAPFYALCKFGQGVDLRGYVSGRYRDETMVTAQAEYRWRFLNNWGMVAFAGVGEVGESLSDYTFDDLLASAGVGLRFRISKKTDLNLSVDYAVGDDSDAWYFYVGESF